MTLVHRPSGPVATAGTSIVIPTFNEEKVIASTLRQFDACKASFNLQTIVSDDASEDRTVAIARALADVVVSNTAGHRGRSGALNRGARCAAYDTLVFLDADIHIVPLPAFLEELQTEFVSQSEVGGGIMDFFVDPREETWSDRVTHLFWNGIQRGVLRLCGVGFPTPGFQMGKRQVFERLGGYDEAIGLSQDIDYSLRLGKAAQFHYFRRARALESPRRYRQEGYPVYACRSALRWASILLRRKSHGQYRLAR